MPPGPAAGLAAGPRFQCAGRAAGTGKGEMGRVAPHLDDALLHRHLMAGNLATALARRRHLQVLVLREGRCGLRHGGTSRAVCSWARSWNAGVGREKPSRPVYHGIKERGRLAEAGGWTTAAESWSSARRGGILPPRGVARRHERCLAAERSSTKRRRLLQRNPSGSSRTCEHVLVCKWGRTVVVWAC